MGLFHRATITPTKGQLVSEWAPTRAWGPPADVPIDVIGSYRFDDPENRVGMETMVVRAADDVLQVPLTYRAEPAPASEAVLITEMDHSALGTRWVYDGLTDERFVVMLAAVAMTGQGEALGMAVYEDRWYIAPSDVRIQGGGWSQERVPVDGFEVTSNSGGVVVFTNDRFELRFFRRPVPGPRPAIGLTARWADQPDPVVLAEVREL